MALIKKGKKEPKNDGSLVNSSLTIRLQIIESIDQAFFHVPVDFCSSLTLSDGVRSAPSDNTTPSLRGADTPYRQRTEEEPNALFYKEQMEGGRETASQVGNSIRLEKEGASRLVDLCTLVQRELTVCDVLCVRRLRAVCNAPCIYR